MALKLESLQRTGSFKVRGAANRILTLSAEERRRGVIAASSGNHGRAVAEVAAQLGLKAAICVPEWADPLKVRAIADAGARVVRCAGGYDAAEMRAARIAAESGYAPVHAFDDPAVIEGQGTIMAEIAEQVAGIEEVLVPLSGGGLAAGVAAAARSRGTFEAVRSLVAEHVVVEESQIREAVRTLFRKCRLVVEGEGAVGVAALRAGYRPRGRAAVILSGGNIDAALLAELVGEDGGQPGKGRSAGQGDQGVPGGHA